MAGKGLVLRDQSQRSHIFYPRLSEEKTQRQMIGDLIVKAFGGSAERLVTQALSSHEVSAEELAQIQKLLDELSGS